MITRNHIFQVILLIPFVSKAQHKTEHVNMLWAGYYNTVHFNKNWSLINDAQLRTRDWTQQWSQLLIRSGLSYNFDDHFSITAGLAFFKNAQYAENQLFLKSEWRPWQEFLFQLKLNKINFSQRLRTEQRFLQQLVNNEKSESYQYIFRLRYRFDWQFPLQENKIKLQIGNEVLVNPGYINSKYFFDQNRTFAGLNFKLQSNKILQCQYLKIFQWHSNTSVMEDQNVIRVNFIQQFNFRKSQE